MHAFVLLTLGVHILKYSGGGTGAVIDGLDETLVNQIGAGFFAAALIWIIVTLRLEDLKGLFEQGQDSLAAAPGMRLKSR
jgi:hypothetical protein